MAALYCSIISYVLIFASCVAALLIAKLPYKSGRIITPYRCIFGGVIFGAFSMFIPIYADYFSGQQAGVFHIILLSVHNTIRLFVVDGEFNFISEYTKNLDAGLCMTYNVLAALLYFLCPALTASFLLSFFHDVTALRQYICSYHLDLYVFSELNENSIFLAQSIKKSDQDRQCRIVFTDAYCAPEERSMELMEKAKELGAACFKKDITQLKWTFRNKSRKTYFFIIGEDEDENINHAVTLTAVEKNKNNPNMCLYVFSTNIESELLFSSLKDCKMQIRRVNTISSLINHTLWKEGIKLFEGAKKQDSGKALISAVIVGLGEHGREMLKALSWFCQMDGYELEIHAFDHDIKAESKLKAACPEMMMRSGIEQKGEAFYRIKVYSGIDVDSSEFAEAIKNLNQTTYVFVALGNDLLNIKIAVHMRTLYEQIALKPRIQSVVYIPERIKALANLKNYREQEYKIEFLGDMQTTYSKENIMDSELENEALERHLKWGKEADFWTYEYNFRSSVAAALHMKVRKECGISGADKRTEDLTPDEKIAIESLEHKRWNAYMRSEGYIFSGSTDKGSRNDLGKMHHDLVPYEKLTEEEKRLDSAVGTK